MENQRMNEIEGCIESIPFKEILNEEENDSIHSSPSSPLILSEIIEILASLVVKIIGVEERLEERTHRVYLVYKFYIYSPFSSWTFYKRYNDFIELQKQVQELLSSHSEYSSFLEYKFPEKHWYWSRDTIITMRTESFQKYVEKSLKIPILAPLIIHFIGFDEHFHEFQMENTSTIIAPTFKPILFDSESEHEETSTSTGYSCKSEFTSNFTVTHLKKSSPHPALNSIFKEQQLQHLSELLDNMTGPCLFSSLPLSGQTERYQLGYATYRDGWNMQTLYKKVGLKYPLILLIRVLGYRGIIGAYMPCPLGPPSFEFKGNSDCYIFKLYNDRIDKYPTRISIPENVEYLKKKHHQVHLDSEPHSRTSSTNNDHDKEHTTSKEEHGPFSFYSLLSAFSFHSSEENKPQNSEDQTKNINSEHSNSSHQVEPPPELSDHNTELSFGELKSDKKDDDEEFNSTLYEFLYSNMDVIIFGGSQKLGTNAIRLSNDLSTFSSGPSDTYGNPSLISQNHENLGSMTVSDIEVFTALGCC
jgi:hypothetical protein